MQGGRCSDVLDSQSSSFEAMASYRAGETPVSPETTAEYARTASVDAQFFRVFGVNPILVAHSQPKRRPRASAESPSSATPIGKATSEAILEYSSARLGWEPRHGPSWE
jgi:hypothetical protein